MAVPPRGLDRLIEEFLPVLLVAPTRRQATRWIASAVRAYGGRAAQSLQGYLGTIERWNGHRPDWIVPRTFDVAVGDAERPLPGGGRLFPCEVFQFRPFIPADLVDPIRRNNRFAAARRLVLSPLEQMRASTERGGDQTRQAGWLAAYLDHDGDQRFVATLGSAMTECLTARDEAPEATPGPVNDITIANLTGTVGSGAATHGAFVSRYWRSGEDVERIVCALLSHRLPTPDPAKAKAYTYAILAKEWPHFAEAGYETTAGPGGETIRIPHPFADHIFLFDLAEADRDEAQAHLRVGASIAVLSSPLGHEVLNWIRNGQDERRAAGRLYSLLGVREVAQDPDLFVQMLTALYARALLERHLESQQAVSERIRVEVEKALGAFTDETGEGLLAQLQDDSGQSVLSTALRSLNDLAQSFMEG